LQANRGQASHSSAVIFDGSGLEMATAAIIKKITATIKMLG
jgi:hypothetical protein